ncbi:MAG: chloride channel protein [Conexivisphaerales archaeon]
MTKASPILGRFLSLPYLEKWLLLGIIIGVVSGIGALAFYFAIKGVEFLFLDKFIGMQVPHPVGEGGSLQYLYSVSRYWLIPVSTTVGGLLSGLIVYTFAPEAEGHGTDAAIDAFHNKRGEIKRRIPLVKMVASAITIGSGGSAGREGPTAQISAGIGSALADLLSLGDSDRRMAVAVGIGSGIGTIFKAPIGGALLAAEILYKRDMEVDAIYPAFIAAAVGYSIFGSVVGFEPIFGYTTYAFSTLRLPMYAVLGLVAGLLAILYVKSFYGVRRMFSRLRIPMHLKPAIGGLVAGIIALAFPEVMATGYGWIQLMIGEKLPEIPTFGLPIIVLLLILPFAKILATSFSVGSGGSGGVFAPGMVIGASLGTILGLLFHYAFPSIAPHVAPFVIVGMLAFFGAAGKVPISVLVMVVEMTGSLQLLPGAMIAVAISYVVSGQYTIYSSQKLTRRESPAHTGEYSIPLLAQIRIKEIKPSDISVKTTDSVETAEEKMEGLGITSLPVVDDNKLLGTVYLNDVLQAKGKKVGELMKQNKIVVGLETTAFDAWESMTKEKSSWAAVLADGKYIGAITMQNILNTYRSKIKEVQDQVDSHL